MPAKFIFYQLPEFVVAPPSQIGTTGELLARLWEQHIPVPPTVCIPTQTLAKVAQNSQLLLKLEQLQRSSASQHYSTVQTHITQLLRRLPLDRTFLHTLSTWYHEYLQADTVEVYASDKTPERETLVVGDASLIESLCSIWAAAITAEMFQQPRRHKSVSQLVASSALLITRQPEPLAAGNATSQNLQNNSKTQIVINSVWGAVGPNSLKHAAQTSIDIRTDTIVATRAHTQKNFYLQGNGELISERLTQSQQAVTPLSTAEAHQLAQYVLQLKRQSLEQVTISWIKNASTVYITGISELEPVDPKTIAPQTQVAAHQRLTKLYITGGNPAKAAEQLAEPVDGVGILRSEHCLARFGVHPLHLLNSPHKEQLRQAMRETIATYQNESHGKLVLFRTENFTSSELAALQHSHSYTEIEVNPYIGYRGALRQLQYPDLLQFQLEVFREALAQSQSPLGIIFPFVRSSEECRRLLQLCKEARLGGPQFAGVWLQLNTPENILNLSEYPLKDLAGVIINTNSVLALAQGIDPDRPELFESYGFPTTTFTHLLKHLVAARSPLGSPTILVYIRTYSHDAVSLAVNAGVDGIIVRPNVASLTKAGIIDAEAARLQHIRTTTL